MPYIPIHMLEFECTNDENLVIPPIFNPSYIYKEGDKIEFYGNIKETPKSLFTVIVSKVQYEIHTFIEGEQLIKIFVEKEL